MRKPVYAICEQQTRSLISAFVLSAWITYHPYFLPLKFQDSYLVSEAEQAGLSLIWSQTPKTGFLITRLIWFQIITHPFRMK